MRRLPIVVLIFLFVLLGCSSISKATPTSQPATTNATPLASTTTSFISSAQAAATIEPVNTSSLLSEDFESSQLLNWNYKVSDWSIITDELTGSAVWTSVTDEVAYAFTGSNDWSDYVFQFQARRLSSNLNIYYRVSGDNGYALRVEANRLVLWTERDGGTVELANATWSAGSTWHNFEIQVQGSQSIILVDGKQILSYSDSSNDLRTGGIALEIISKGGGRFDNIKVTRLTQETTSTANLSTGQWEQTNGPQGGVINTIEIDPSNPDVLYAGGIGGVFKSTNDGVSWSQEAQFLSSFGTVRNLLLDPKETNVIYAESGRLFKSSDGGETWKMLLNGQPTSSVAMDPEDPTRLMIGNYLGQVWLSKDAGVTWRNVSSGLPDFNINALAFGAGENLWAGSGLAGGVTEGHLYHSSNDGASWSMVDLNQDAETQIHSIFVDPNDRETIYVGLGNIYNEMFNPRTANYFLKTTDNGVNWNILRLPHTDAMINVIGCTIFDKTLYVGSGGHLYASSDAGSTWREITLVGRKGDMYDIAVDPRDTDVLYLPLRAYGIVKSVDKGLDWSPIDEGLLDTTVSLIALGDSSGSTLYATSAAGEGTFKSTDYGNKWINITNGGIDHPWADELAVSPIDTQTVWEIADVGNFYVSHDAGSSWQKTVDSYGGGFRAGTISAVAVSPDHPDIIYTVKSGFGIFKTDNGMKNWAFLHDSEVDYTYSLAINPIDPDIVFSGDVHKPFQVQARVQRTLDGGQSWSTVLAIPNADAITSVAIDPQNPQIIYAGGTATSANGGGQIYRSENNGDTWLPLNPHFIMLTVWGQPQLVGDPNNPSTIYAATWLAGTWKSTDAGRTWTKLEDAPASATSLSIDPKDPNVIYATDRTAPKLWKSTDGGSSWNVIANFISDGAFLLNRVLTDGTSVYVSTFGPSIHAGKLYHSTNGGRTWADITNGLPRSVLDIAINPADPDDLFVTTHIHGAYESKDGGQSWQELTGFPDIGAYDIEIDPTSPEILYAAGLGGQVPEWVLEGGYTFREPAGAYKSTDGGRTWKQILVTTNECRAIRIDPSDHNLLFVSSLTDGFFVSRDGGATWKNYNSGLDSTNLTSVWVNGNKVYVGTQGFGVYSGNLDPSTGTVVWVAERSNKPVPDVYSLQIQVDPTNADRIYVGSNPGGLYRSDDGGRSWYDKNFLTPSVLVDDPRRQGYYTFAINPDDPNEVWVGTWGKGIYKSYDGQDYNIGANGNDHSMYSKHVNALLFDPGLGLIAATEEGVFYTQDGGATWTDWSAGLVNLQVRTLSLLPGGTVLCGTAGYELYRRIPTGSQWQQVAPLANYGTFWPIWNNRPLYQYSQLLFDPTDANTIYFGTFPEGIFKSTDGGQTWRESNVGWTVDGVFTLVFQPQSNEIIYAGTYNGINRSLDGGAHWEMWNKGWPSQQWVFSIAFDPTNPEIMYACSKNGENEGTGRAGFHGTVMKSTDGGATWFAITNGLDLNNEFYKIIVDRFDGNTVYLATQHDGVYISRDSGQSWKPFNEGLTNLEAGTNGNNVTNTMALSDDGKVLYFGTAGSGVFRRFLTQP